MMNQKSRNLKEVWYFSGTGQGRYLAEQIHNQNKEYQIVNITSEASRKRFKLVENKEIVLIFPVYATTVPFPLQEFLREIEGHNTSIIIISLWGNGHNATSLACANDILVRQGFHVVGAAKIVAQHSCLMDQSINVFKDQKLSRIIEYIEESFQCHHTPEVGKGKDALLTRLMCALPKSGAVKMATRFQYKEEQCIHCNACIRICPTCARISPTKINSKQCIRCYACATACKKGAIELYTRKIARVALMHDQKIMHSDVFY